ncbi:MAG: xanthine dehydrogenase family protein molybdopterin-binding subunit [Dongiaceae bacterium]
MIGRSLPRREDERLLRGAGRFIEDLRLDGMLHAVVRRSDHAHARLLAVDIEEARQMPGVVAIFRGADLQAAGIPPLPCVRPIESVDGRPWAPPPRHPLAIDTVRHVGDPVALVVAETPEQAADAADAVLVECEALPAAVDPARREHEAFVWEKGDAAAVEAAIAAAAHVVECRVVSNRVFMAPVEPRGAIGTFDAADESYCLYTPSQGAHLIRRLVALSLAIPEARLRVVTEDVGGSFGLKLVNHPEQTLVLFAARALGRPVRWVARRSESFLADNAGRDHRSRAVAAFDGQGRCLALQVETIGNLGAYASAVSPTTHTAGFAATLGGAYAIPAIHVRSIGVYTNLTPTDAYRGSGKPESLYLTERLMDAAARQLGIERLELRRRNAVPPEAMPYKAATGTVFDSGDFPGIVARAAAQADWGGFPARRQAALARGRRRGIGLSLYIHTTGVTSSEVSRVLLDPAGRVVVRTGLQSSGQGHETTLAQLVADRLELAADAVAIEQGDTALLGPTGGPTAGSSSLQVGGVTILRAAERMLAAPRAAAGELLEAAEADLAYGAGRFVIRGTDRAVTLAEIARRQAADGLPGCAGEAALEGPTLTVPNGAYVAEVEIDAETGAVALVRFSGVDDLGRRLNPMVVEGQLHGSIAQGIGQALLEQAVYDPESGQLLTGSFMDYGLPRADDLPFFELLAADIPTGNNPLGMKGAAEVGCIGAPAAVMNAIIDALDGVEIDMPATPESVWRALNRRPLP